MVQFNLYMYKLFIHTSVHCFKLDLNKLHAIERDRKWEGEDL